MDLTQQPLVQKASDFCTTLLNSRLPPYLVFHNLCHTASVAEAAFDIGVHSGLSEEELQVVTVAAWFHDTGYCRRYKGHEEFSKQIAAMFLQEQRCAPAFQERVLACIEATKEGFPPRSMAEQVLHDADMSHLGKPLFQSYAALLKKELEAVHDTPITEREWHRQNVTFLEKQTFYTPYARALYQEQKNKNLEKEREFLR